MSNATVRFPQFQCLGLCQHERKLYLKDMNLVQTIYPNWLRLLLLFLCRICLCDLIAGSMWRCTFDIENMTRLYYLPRHRKPLLLRSCLWRHPTGSVVVFPWSVLLFPDEPVWGWTGELVSVGCFGRLSYSAPDISAISTIENTNKTVQQLFQRPATKTCWRYSKKVTFVKTCFSLQTLIVIIGKSHANHVIEKVRKIIAGIESACIAFFETLTCITRIHFMHYRLASHS